MRKLAQGDLTANFAARGRDEVSQLIGAFNASREQLLGLVQRISEVSETLDANGRQIAAASEDLSSARSVTFGGDPRDERQRARREGERAAQSRQRAAR